MGVRKLEGGGGSPPPPPKAYLYLLTLKSIRIYIRLSVAQRGNNNKHCTYRQITLQKVDQMGSFPKLTATL